MADATIDLQASNLFSLGAEFKTQSSGTNTATTNVLVQDETGNVSCETNIQDIINYSQSAQYCASGTADFVGDLGTFLTQFGNVQNSKVVTGLTINMTAGEYCSIDIEGHNHINAHTAGLDLGYADVSDFLPHELTESFYQWDGFGVPDFRIVTTSGGASPVSATVTFAMNHVDQIDEEGQHLVGKNITPRCELSMEFSGIIDNTDLSGVTSIEGDLRANTNAMLTPYADSKDSNDSNSDFDSFSFTAHAHTTLAV